MKNLTFGEYIEQLRKERSQSFRKCAEAIGVSAQFFSEVEKNRRPAFTAERLEKLKDFLHLNEEESTIMYDKAAESYKGKGIMVPADFSDYIVERDYAMAALRKAKELDADEKDWQVFIDELCKRKGLDNQ